jgi:hypothetical protein
MLSDEMRYKLLRLLQSEPRASQQDVARQSRQRRLLPAGFDTERLGDTTHFRNSRNKAAYL